VLGDGLSSSVVGVAFGHSETDISVTDGGGDVDGVHVGLYGAHQRGRLNVSAAAGYSWFDFDLSRRLDLDGDFVSASAEPDGHALSGSLQVSYDIAEMLGTPGWLVAPTARLNAVSAHRDGFTEEGADILDLTVEEDDLNQVLPAAGISLGATWSSGGLVVKPELQLLYEHVFGDTDVTGESAIPVADATFTSEVSAGGRNRLALGAGLGVAFSNAISAHLRYDGSLSGEANGHRASGAFSVRF
jgi:outer membrane autotransporter protein